MGFFFTITTSRNVFLIRFPEVVFGRVAAEFSCLGCLVSFSLPPSNTLYFVFAQNCTWPARRPLRKNRHRNRTTTATRPSTKRTWCRRKRNGPPNGHRTTTAVTAVNSSSNNNSRNSSTNATSTRRRRENRRSPRTAARVTTTRNRVTGTARVRRPDLGVRLRRFGARLWSPRSRLRWSRKSSTTLSGLD